MVAVERGGVGDGGGCRMGKAVWMAHREGAAVAVIEEHRLLVWLVRVRIVTAAAAAELCSGEG